MKKIDSLRKYLTEALPGLATKPENLFLAIDDGRLVASQGSKNFRDKATVTVTFLEVPAAQIHAVSVAILFWAADNQPELLEPGSIADKGIPYNVEMLDREFCDLAFQLSLDELVTVTPREGGGFDIAQREEPDLNPGWTHLNGWKTDAQLLRLYVGDDLVLGPPEP